MSASGRILSPRKPTPISTAIFVSPSQRGTTTVGRLCQAVFDFCAREKLDRVVFRTRATNEPMKAVLARVGFVPTQIFYERQITEKG